MVKRKDEDGEKKVNKKKSEFIVKDGETLFKYRDGSLYNEANLDNLLTAIKRKVKADKLFELYFDDGLF